MTTTIERAGKAKPTLEQILKAAPMLTRAERTLEPLLLAQGPAATSSVLVHSPKLTDGKRVPMTAELRDELLRMIDAGELGYCEVDVPMLAYEQQAGVDNWNYVGFRNASMRAIGKTGAGKPFLRDHEQRDSMARGGTLVESGTEVPSDGHYEIRQVARLTEPWAIAMYLRGNMTTVSIGWIPTGPVLCSVCDAPVMSQCYHWPGDQLVELTDGAGKKRYERRRDGTGTLTVRWIYTAAELIETSCVPVPGVPTAGMDQLRATLSASFSIDDDTDDGSAAAVRAFADDNDKSPPSPATPTVDSQPESTQMADQPDQTPKLATMRKALMAALTLPESHRAHAAKLDAEAAEGFCLESATVREAAVRAALDADPVVFTGELTGVTVRASHGDLARRLAEQGEAQAKQLALQEDALAKARSTNDENDIAAICATRIPNLPGSALVHANIVRALRGAGDPALLEESLKALQGASAFVQAAGRAPGINEDTDAGNESALEAFNVALSAFAQAKGQTPAQATQAFLATAQGDALYTAYDQERRSSRTAR